MNRPAAHFDGSPMSSETVQEYLVDGDPAIADDFRAHVHRVAYPPSTPHDVMTVERSDASVLTIGTGETGGVIFFLESDSDPDVGFSCYDSFPEAEALLIVERFLSRDAHWDADIRWRRQVYPTWTDIFTRLRPLLIIAGMVLIYLWILSQE